MSSHPLPWSLQENPRLEKWVDFSEPGIVRVFSAKVELGQGIVTALAQIAAEELKLPIAKVQVVSGDTRRSPNESYTAGSMSIEIGGTALRIACAQSRERILRHVATARNVEPARLSSSDGSILIDGEHSGLDYWKVARELDWSAPVSGDVAFVEPRDAKYIGKSIERCDLPAKVVGGAFIHDLQLTAMLHARVLRPPSYGAHLESLEESTVARLAGVVKIVRSGDFVGVCCEREYQAVKALDALRAGAKWNESDSKRVDQNWKESLPRRKSFDSQTQTGESPTAVGDVMRVSATYSRPPIAHASMAPSCAVARFDGDQLTVWTHSQGVFPLRAALAAMLAIDEANITVVHVQGAGCYGHNAADDVAADAALLAREVPSRPVRVQWTREDELSWAPFGSPMVVQIDGAVTPGGEIVGWSTEIWSGPHGRRPSGRAVNLLAAAHKDRPITFPPLHEDLARFAGGARNSEPSYSLPYRKLVLHSLPDLPFRTSALRTLGGYANVFAVESFMDELAEAAGIDPVAFRLRNLSDPRARQVIETAARLASWRESGERGTGRAQGIGFCRYKNTAAYVAVVASVAVDKEVRVERISCAVDAGLTINPDGVVNQIEGGITQSISWTLKEQVRFDAHGMSQRSWEDYPILAFSEAPEITVELVERRAEPPLGVGEASQGPTAAAVANAVARALDLRIRELPLTSDRIIAASG